MKTRIYRTSDNYRHRIPEKYILGGGFVPMYYFSEETELPRVDLSEKEWPKTLFGKPPQYLAYSPGWNDLDNFNKEDTTPKIYDGDITLQRNYDGVQIIIGQPWPMDGMTLKYIAYLNECQEAWLLQRKDPSEDV